MECILVFIPTITQFQQYQLENQQQQQQRRGTTRSSPPNASSSAAHSSGGGGGGGESTAEVVQALSESMLLLKEMILACTHHGDFRHNEVAQEVLQQMQVFQAKMPALIEQALATDPDVSRFSTFINIAFM